MVTCSFLILFSSGNYAYGTVCPCLPDRLSYTISANVQDIKNILCLTSFVGKKKKSKEVEMG